MNVQEKEITEYINKLWNKSKRQTSEYEGAWTAITLLGYDISRSSEGAHFLSKNKKEDIAQIVRLCNEYLHQFGNISKKTERFANFNNFVGISNVVRFAGFAWYKKKNGDIFFYRKSEEDQNADNETALRSFRGLKHDDVIINTKTGQVYKVIVTITGKVLLTSLTDNVVHETKGKKAREYVKVK